jgi:integrase
MQEMPRPRPPYLNRAITRHGRAVWYVRVGHGDQRRRVRLRAQYGTPEFDIEYRAALAGQETIQEGAAGVGTLAWLIKRYRETTTWTTLSPATRRQRENIFKQVLTTAGTEPLAGITKNAIISGRERRAATPFQARHFLQAMRGLFRWAADAGHIKVDPTREVRDLPKPRNDGFPIWTEDDVAAYERRWPIGTRQRVWLDVLLYTGLRRGDAVRLGRQHVRDDVATITTEKSSGSIEVTIPILPVLAVTCARARAAISRSLPVRAAGHSPKNHSATNFATPAVRPVCPVLHMGCGRSRRLAPRTTARQFRSLKQFLDGPAVAWPRTTRAPPIAGG